MMLLLGKMGKYAAHDVRITNYIKLGLFYHHPCLMQGEEGNTALCPLVTSPTETYLWP